MKLHMIQTGRTKTVNTRKGTKNNKMCFLHQLKIGQTATVVKLHHKGSMRRRLQDMGLVEHSTVKCVGKSPFGDPRAYLISDAVIALRRRDAAYIEILENGE